MPHITVCAYNVWGLRRPARMRKFFEQYADDVDIFGFTEVYDINQKNLSDLPRKIAYRHRKDDPAFHINAYRELKEMLGQRYSSQYDSGVIHDIVCAKHDTIFRDVGFGSALFWRRRAGVVCRHTLPIQGEQNTNPRVLQILVFEKEGVKHLFAHLHGIWIRGNTKGDHPLRIEQSHLILNALGESIKRHKIEKVIFGGDLNLGLNTQALKILEAGGSGVPRLRNLVRELKVPSTRTEKYRDHRNPEACLHADYLLVSENVDVQEFRVLTDVLASDHAPLILRYS